MDSIGQYEKESPIEHIQAVFQDSLINCRWKKIAELLGTPKACVEKLKMELILRNRRHAEILQDVFMYWRLENLANGTVKNFLEIIGNDAELKSIIDKVKASVANNALLIQPLDWDKLDYQTKEIILTKQIWFMGKKRSLINICGNLEELDFSTILQKTLCSTTLANLTNGIDYEVTKDSIPEPCSVYIPRRLLIKRQLDAQIFSLSHEKDVFIVKGIEMLDFSKLTRGQMIEFSGTQRRKVTVSFIILEEDDHVDAIFKRTAKSVHVVSYTERKFYWLKSKGSIGFLKQYLVNEAENVNENFLVDKFEKHENSIICISDVSGAGKSTFLASLARKISELYPERVVVFIKISELLQLLPKKDFTDDTFWQLLAKELSCNEIGRYLLLQMFLHKNICKEVFVDGFGEHFTTGKRSITDFLEGISTIPNLRLCVTTQSIIQSEVEETFAVLAYGLAPFTLQEQIKFLVEFWAPSGNDSSKQRIMDYARHCILSSNVSDNEIVGIPLICLMLADIHALEAKQYASCGKSPFSVRPRYISITDIYWDYMNVILHALNPEQRHSLYHLAIISVFDTSDNHVEKIWDYQKAKQIVKPPILGNFPNFLHRSFAEFIIAHVMANAIGKFVHEPNLSEEIFEILPLILRTDCNLLNGTIFRETRLCYFLNDLVQRIHMSGRQNYLFITSQQQKFMFKSIGSQSNILKACVFHKMYQLLFLILGISAELPCTGVTKKLWKNILLITTCYADLNIVQNLMQGHSVAEVCEMQFKDWRNANKKLTPLHVAIQRGNLPLFEYFFEVYRTKLHNIRGLIHAAVENSEDQGWETVKDKMKIIQTLVDHVGAHLLNQTLEENCTPILMDRVHLKLFKKLVKEGAEITSLTTNNSNVAHVVSSSMNPSDYHNFVNFLVFNNKESLLRNHNSFQESAFQIALENISLLPETVSLLSTTLVTTEWKENKYQENFVYHLVKNNYNKVSLEKALKNTTSWPNLIYKNGKTTLLHIAVRWRNVQATSLCIEKESDCNAMDEYGETPLHIACNSELNSKLEAGVMSTIIDLLTDNGADVNIPDTNGYTPLSFILDQIE